MLLVQPADVESPAHLPGDQPVMPDGTIKLGKYGRLQVVGKTVEEIEAAVKGSGRGPDQGRGRHHGARGDADQQGLLRPRRGQRTRRLPAQRPRDGAGRGAGGRRPDRPARATRSSWTGRRRPTLAAWCCRSAGARSSSSATPRPITRSRPATAFTCRRGPLGAFAPSRPARAALGRRRRVPSRRRADVRHGDRRGRSAAGRTVGADDSDDSGETMNVVRAEPRVAPDSSRHSDADLHSCNDPPILTVFRKNAPGKLAALRRLLRVAPPSGNSGCPVRNGGL